MENGRSVIGCKWVFKAKYTNDGRVDRYKGRLVAKGYSRTQGIDYDEKISPVVTYSSVRALLAYGQQRGMLIHQMDVVTAFLNGELEEDIYMEQSEGFVVEGQETLVCKLNNSLYGLKQSPRCWNSTRDKQLKLMGFANSCADHCVYVRSGNHSCLC